MKTGKKGMKSKTLEKPDGGNYNYFNTVALLSRKQDYYSIQERNYRTITRLTPSLQS